LVRQVGSNMKTNALTGLQPAPRRSPRMDRRPL
jgi:hypothetical protein